MALSGGWKQGVMAQSMPTKWGTGIHPVHAIATEGTERASQTARLIAPNYGAHIGDIIPVEETDTESQYRFEEDAWTPDEDLYASIWGYGDATGTGDRPRWDAEPSDYRGSTELLRGDTYPAMSDSGTHIRSQSHGANVTQRVKKTPTETVSEGWENKTHGEVFDPGVADIAQVTRQTSMQQRDKTRAGSQRGEGSQSEFEQPIHSRIPGIRLKLWSGGQRHYDMFPRQADVVIRPWWSRTAGAAPAALMEPNAVELNTAYARTVPGDPSTDASVPLTDNHGYVEEDAIPYA